MRGWLPLVLMPLHWAASARPRRFKNGRCKRHYSVFQEGLNLWFVLKRQRRAICLKLCFIWDKPPD